MAAVGIAVSLPEVDKLDGVVVSPTGVLRWASEGLVCCARITPDLMLRGRTRLDCK